MKIILVGATGVIGKAVFDSLNTHGHEVIRVARKAGDIKADITDEASIKAMYQQVSGFDAMVCAAGELNFCPLEQMDNEKYQLGLGSKLMGQVNLVLLGRDSIHDGGSFTLSSGGLSQDPWQGGSSASMVNSALEGFTRAAAIELPRAMRINCVSPTVVTQSLPIFGDIFSGYGHADVTEVALSYIKSVHGLQTGQIYHAGW